MTHEFNQTLYINSDRDSFKDTFGWAAPEYYLMGWTLSCLQLHKLYKDISLYANSKGAQLLVDTLNLPYAEVYLTHDELTLIHPALWALPKIWTEVQNTFNLQLVGTSVPPPCCDVIPER